MIVSLTEEQIMLRNEIKKAEEAEQEKHRETWGGNDN